MAAPAPLRVALVILLVLVALFAAQSSAEDFELFEDRSLGLWYVEVERNTNLGGYLAVSISGESTQNTSKLRARRVEARNGRTKLHPSVLLSSTNRFASGPHLSFSTRQGVYLLVFGLTPKGKPMGPFGQILAADGKPLSSTFRIAPDEGCGLGEVYGAEYSSLTNRWLVAWAGIAVSNRLPNCERVRARFVRSTGEPGHEVRVTRGGDSLRSGGGLAYEAQNSEFLVVWSEGSRLMFGRRIRERGKRNGKRIALARPAGNCVFFPRAAGSSAGRFLVTWQDRCSDDGLWSLDSRVLEPDNRLRRTRSFRTALIPHIEDVAFNEPSGRFVAAWEEVADPGGSGAQRAVRSQTFRGRGRLLGASSALGRRRSFESFEFPRISCSAKRPECLTVWLGDFGTAWGEVVSARK